MYQPATFFVTDVQLYPWKWITAHGQFCKTTQSSKYCHGGTA